MPPRLNIDNYIVNIPYTAPPQISRHIIKYDDIPCATAVYYTSIITYSTTNLGGNIVAIS